jgi:hypothetical protein
MTFKIGDMVRESKYRDIGRVYSVPSDKQDYYIVSFDGTKIRYSETQIVSGALRLLHSVTP